MMMNDRRPLRQPQATGKAVGGGGVETGMYMNILARTLLMSIKQQTRRFIMKVIRQIRTG